MSECRVTDQGSAALVVDLARRGLLEDTLVVWGGELGRTPVAQKPMAAGGRVGRDHQIEAFTMWFAGGGVRAGQVIGETNDLGCLPTEAGWHVHDLQATILHALGLDHERLTYRYEGREFRLTDIHDAGDAVTLHTGWWDNINASNMTACTGDPSHCMWGVERRGEFSPLGHRAGCFLGLGSGLGLVRTASSRR